jgi:hypothetical protein
MSLLRTVGHVLDEVDLPAADRATRRRIVALRKRLFAPRKSEPHIFHDFIYAEGGDVVHQYKLGAAVKITATGNAPSGTAATIEHWFMPDGPFKGLDTLVLCRKAIVFWRTYLDAIDEPHGKAERR